MAKRLTFLRAAFVVGSAILFSATTTQAQDEAPEELLNEDVTISVVTFIPNHFVELDGYHMFVELVKERFGGRMKIEYLGAGEAVAPFEQPEAVRKGIVDITFTGATYPEGIMPVSSAMDVSLLTPAEEREQGIYDRWRELYEEQLNAVYLGRFLYYPHHLWTTFEVDDLDDFAGRTFRTSPAQRPLVEALSGSAVVLPPGEIHTALERGVVDGFGWPSVGVIDLGVAELTSHRVDPGFYGGSGPILMNADTFYALPEAAQEQMLAIGAELEETIVKHFIQLTVKEGERLATEFGVTPIELDPEAAEEYLRFAYEAMWEHVMGGDPDVGRELFEKTYEGRQLVNPIDRLVD